MNFKLLSSDTKIPAIEEEAVTMLDANIPQIENNVNIEHFQVPQVAESVKKELK